MIDTISVISNGGVVLWTHSNQQAPRRSVINKFIHEILLEDRTGEREYIFSDYKMRWVLNNELNFFVVAVYPKFLMLQCVDQFLKEAVSKFEEKFGKNILQPFGQTFDFSSDFEPLLAKLEASEHSIGKQAPFKDDSPDDLAEPEAHLTEEEEEEKNESDQLETVKDQKNDTSASHPIQPATAHREGDFIITKDGRRIAVRGKASTRTGAGLQSGPAPAAGAKPKRPPKQPTTWGTKVTDPALHATPKAPTEEELKASAEMQKNTYIKRMPNGMVAPVKEKEWNKASRGGLASWLRSYVGSRELDQRDFDNVIPKLKDKLISKNVAVEVAEHVCSSVQASITGKKLGTFESLHKVINEAMVTSLRRILQPKHEVNILRDVAASKSRMRPYSIVFCGVNGVGKSTSLAKIAFWLQQNGNSVLLVAGDTFRHGAIEQLEVHGRCLGVPVFQMGYGADPSAVGAAAIAQAAREHVDVVMIDTAGRMQDHESRMRALAKLIHDNQPNLVLFVGEALVGNNGVDQLRKFNQCLVDYAPIGMPRRGIDGIVLTKFDTVDEKTGAALSMVYELGQPIVFVGVGQTYQDLKVLETDVVVSALMS